MTAAVQATCEARTLHTEHCMGTVFTIDIRDPDTWDTAIHAVVEWLHHIDAVFSTYRPDSDMSRMRRNDLRLADAADEVRTVLDLCADAQRDTHGYFSAMHGGAIDPTGLVKGWAIEQASVILRSYGSVNHAVNGGGDMQLAGESAAGRPWRVGIADPHDRRRVVSVIEGRDLAVATSGIAERGHHIFDPFTGRPSTGWDSATVTGPSLTTADAYATAAFVMGERAVDWIQPIPGHEVLLIGPNGLMRRSAGWPAATNED